MSDAYKRAGLLLPPDRHDREAVVLVELIAARAALLHLHALNGSTHYHDAMRGAYDAAYLALGVPPDELNTLAEAYMHDEGGE